MNGKTAWCATCARILEIDGPRYDNLQISARIETETGKKVSERTIRRYREAAQIKRDRRHDNGWIGALRRHAPQHFHAWDWEQSTPLRNWWHK